MTPRQRVPAAPALVVFDVAGTTVRDRGEVPAAFAEALADTGIHVHSQEIAAWRGASKRDAVAYLVTRHFGALDEPQRAARIAQVYARFRATLAASLASAPDLSMPHAVSTFERLRTAGIKIALNSGFDRDIMDLILRRVGWPAGLLDAVVCGDDVAAGRPAPDLILESMERTGVRDPDRVAAVGDTRLDLEAAAAAGARYRIGVLSGAHGREILEAAPCTHLVQSVAAVPDIWGL